jgi:hypothetical protein
MSFGRVDSYGIDPPKTFKVVPPSTAMRDTAKAGKTITRYLGRCRVFNVCIDDEREEYEALLTKHVNGDSSIEILSEQHSFGRDGEFLVAVKWVETKRK